MRLIKVGNYSKIDEQERSLIQGGGGGVGVFSQLWQHGPVGKFKGRPGFDIPSPPKTYNPNKSLSAKSWGQCGQ